MQFVNNAREKVARMLRGNRDRSAEAIRPRPVKHFHATEWLLRLLVIGVLVAMVVEWGWAVLFTINTTGQLVLNSSWSLGQPVEWVAAFDGRWPVLTGRAASMIVIVIWSMIWLPVWFMARGGGRWARISMAVVGLWCNALVAMQGTFVLNETRQDQVRHDLDVQQTAAQDRQGLIAQRDLLQSRLDALINPDNNSFQAQAARAGVAGWAVYVETARRQLQEGQTSAGRFALIESASGSAVAAEDLQGRIDRLTGQIANAPTEASVAANVEDREGAAMNAAGQAVEVYWPMGAAFGTTAFGILAAWWLTIIWGLSNARDVQRSGWADEGHRIEDLREEEPIPAGAPAPLRQKQRVYNAETGAEEVFVQPKGYWRKTGKKKRNADGTEGEIAEFMPDAQPDETGVEYDGGQRVGSAQSRANNDDGHGDDADTSHAHGQDSADALPGVAELPVTMEQSADHADAEEQTPPELQPESSSDSDLTQDDYMALEAFGADEASVLQPAEAAEREPEARDESEDDGNDAKEHFEQDHYDLPGSEGVMYADAEEEQQDAHVRLRGRLIAAE